MTQRGGILLLVAAGRQLLITNKLIRVQLAAAAAAVPLLHQLLAGLMMGVW
jgi:hypothetical protein